MHLRNRLPFSIFISLIYYSYDKAVTQTTAKKDHGAGGFLCALLCLFYTNASQRQRQRDSSAIENI